jgi:hypothetical protein
MTIFIPDLPEYAPLRLGVEARTDCHITGPRNGYWRVDAANELTLTRKGLGLAPALWYSCLSGGFLGRITQFDRDTLRMIDD